MATRTIYNGRDTNIKYQLLDAGAVKDLSNLTKIDLVFSSTIKVTGTVGSVAPLDFSTTKTELVLKFGQAGITVAAGSYPSVKVIVYDGEVPNGLVWGQISLVVKDNPYTTN
tara:strand:+ start:566 stop:901 length:336 start_codon:yes stop_codon:yes gene_type:complete